MPETRSLQRHVTGGPLYKALAKQAGKAFSCDAQVEESKTTLTYKFRNHFELRAQVNASIEASEQRVTGQITIARAIQLLKSAEQSEYKGCGIDWEHTAETTPTRDGKEDVYRGGSCNCQARITSRDHYAIQLVLRSAC